MKISVKTLKGEQFQIDVDPTDLISAVKTAIASQKPDMPANRQKLIHSGKVLKDSQTLGETGIAENEFLVCMLTKEVKAKPQTQSAPPTTNLPVVSSPPPQTSQQQASDSSTPTNTSVSQSAQSIISESTTTTPAPQAQTIQAPPAPNRETVVDPNAVRQLMDMGFPEEESTTALRAAMGNSDVAVEFLMNGIPPHALAAAGMGGGASQNTSLNDSMDSASSGGIEQLRSHPQINELRRVVQSNPSALSQVLEAIGQQNPALLQLIHANQAEFLAMMNEPITESDSSQQSAPQGGNQLPPPHLPSGEPNPMQLIQMIQQLPEEQRAAAAQSLGMTPEQLQAFSQMISQIPPDQLQHILAGMGGAGGGGGGGGNVIRLTEEEMNSVTRLTELGFDQQDAVAAYLACDKNEALAANMLMDGWNMEDGGEDNN